MRIAVLAYHANNMASNAYADNDHVALVEDLRLIHRLRLPVISAHQAVAMLRDGTPGPERAVVLTSDDAPLFDWHDLDYPGLGLQRGFRGLLQDHARATGQQVHLTCFAIASPEARIQLDRSATTHAALSATSIHGPRPTPRSARPPTGSMRTARRDRGAACLLTRMANATTS